MGRALLSITSMNPEDEANESLEPLATEAHETQGPILPVPKLTTKNLTTKNLTTKNLTTKNLTIKNFTTTTRFVPRHRSRSACVEVRVAGSSGRGEWHRGAL